MKPTILTLSLLAALSTTAQAGNLWEVSQVAERAAASHNPRVSGGTTFYVDPAQLKASIASQDELFEIPLPNGDTLELRLVEDSVMEPKLAARYPELKTFIGVDKTGKRLGRFDYTPRGFHGMFRYQGQTIYVDPVKDNNSAYLVYTRSNVVVPEGVTEGEIIGEAHHEEVARRMERTGARKQTARRTLKIAFSADSKYSSYFGGTKAGVMAAFVTMTNRLNEVYETDLNVTLQLIDESRNTIFLNQSSDPFYGVEDVLSKNIDVQSRYIGNSKFDVGHYVTRGSGGVAYLGSVCTNSKAGGMTGSRIPDTDAFWIDYVAHEVGHQFGGPHTFNGQLSSCGGRNRSSRSSYEPGSGTTIMGYAGICSSQNVQRNSDAYFHSRSIDFMQAHLSRYPNCGTTQTQNNTAPTVNAGKDYTVPANTPLLLTGSGSDAEQSRISYTWEQVDLGSAENTKSDTHNGRRYDGPLFRSFKPKSSPTRYLPQLSDILNDSETFGEVLPKVSRNMNFRLTARDNIGGVSYDEMRIKVENTGRAFAVTSNLRGTLAGGSSQTVTWDVAGTNSSPIYCSNVDIHLFDKNGAGQSYVVAQGTANDGRETVKLPNEAINSARFRIKCSDNIFLAFSDNNINVTKSANEDDDGNDIRDGSDDIGLGTGGGHENEAPRIVGFNAPRAYEDQSFTLRLGQHVEVEDPDSTNITLQVLSGTNYTVSRNVVRPKSNFSGDLRVNFKVHDGEKSSQTRSGRVYVHPQNDAPVITKTTSVSVYAEQAFTLKLGQHVTATDVDHDAQKELKLRIQPGSRYSAAGSTFTVNKGVIGRINLPVYVEDTNGAKSQTRNITVNVKTRAVQTNTAPYVTSTSSFSMPYGYGVKLRLNRHIFAYDKESGTENLELKIVEWGNNYEIIDGYVFPKRAGSILVAFRVSDGQKDSHLYGMRLYVYHNNPVWTNRYEKAQLLTGTTSDEQLSIENTSALPGVDFPADISNDFRQLDNTGDSDVSTGGSDATDGSNSDATATPDTASGNTGAENTKKDDDSGSMFWLLGLVPGLMVRRKKA
ncbi:reprolysin-like metallopeptidase [Algicola sagamiensis]|uniref:reprolysin-like metallopeptidase n=1 Tax=Algicola sagamiensis TaxID=163869 RepID=UPI001B7FA4CE|nr:zinc-dependent metalloprotease family protein [Algicola sagamiensis]